MFKPLFFLLPLYCCVSIAAAEPPTVLVAPFDESGAERHPWIGSTLHRGLLAELEHDASAKAVVPPAGVKLTYDDATIATAVEAGKAVGASHVVVGRYEVAPQGLIVIGQTIRVPGGDSAGKIEVIGKPRDLFRVQSKVADQVKAALGAAAPARQQREHRIDAPVAPRDVDAPVLYSDSDGDPVLNLATGVAIQRAMQRQRRDDDAPLTLRPPAEAQLHRSEAGEPRRDRADDVGSAVERAPLERTSIERTDAPRFGNTISAGGNTMGGAGNAMGASGNTTDGSGLSITGSPGSVMNGGSGNIFLGGSGNSTGPTGNFMNGGDGNEVIQPWFHQIIGGDAHVMQSGDGNYIKDGPGNSIRFGPGNTMGSTGGNTVGGGPGNTVSAGPGSAGGAGGVNSGPRNTVTSSSGNSNGR